MDDEYAQHGKMNNEEDKDDKRGEEYYGEYDGEHSTDVNRDEMSDTLMNEVERLEIENDKMQEGVSMLWRKIQEFRSTGPNDLILSNCTATKFYDFMRQNSKTLIDMNKKLTDAQYNIECRENKLLQKLEHKDMNS